MYILHILIFVYLDLYVYVYFVYILYILYVDVCLMWFDVYFKRFDVSCRKFSIASSVYFGVPDDKKVRNFVTFFLVFLCICLYLSVFVFFCICIPFFVFL